MRLEQDGDRARGDALVGLKSLADVENAVKFHKQQIGGRSIDIYQCESLFPDENPQDAISSPGQILPAHQQPGQRSRTQPPPSLAPPQLAELSLSVPSYPQLTVTNLSDDTRPIPVDLLSLPWSATEEEIRRFVGSEGAVLKVLIVLNEYRKPSGRARVWLQTEEDVCRALERSNQYLDTRRVEVRRGVSELAREIPGDHYIRLDKLPWQVTESQIRDFLFGCRVEEVDIGRDERGRVRGDAGVKVATLADVENALLFHKQLIGSRNIDVLQSGPSSSAKPVRPISVDLTGLSMSAGEQEVRTFLSGVVILKVLMVLQDYNKPSGSARIWVPDMGELGKALIKDGDSMGERKIRVR